METKVISILVKRGNNPEDSKKMVSIHLDRAIKAFPQARAPKLAELVRCWY